MIVLSLVAVGVVWVVISNVLSSGTKQVSSGVGQLLINLKLENVKIESNGDVSVTVKRNAGQGEISGINLIVSDGTNSQVIKKDATLQELGTQTFTITSSELTDVAFVKDVSIAPFTKDSSGKETVGNAIGKKEFPPRSCLDMLNRKLSNGNGLYSIDPVGTGSIQVYCDMTTNDGGWTLMTMSSGTPTNNLFISTTSNRDVTVGNIGTNLTMGGGLWYSNIRWGPSNAQSTNWADVAYPVYNKRSDGTTSWFNSVGNGGTGFSPAADYKCLWTASYVSVPYASGMYASLNFPSNSWNIPNYPAGGSYDGVLPSIYFPSGSTLSKTNAVGGGTECNSGDARTTRIQLWVR